MNPNTKYFERGHTKRVAATGLVDNFGSWTRWELATAYTKPACPHENRKATPARHGALSSGRGVQFLEVRSPAGGWQGIQLTQKSARKDKRIVLAGSARKSQGRRRI